MWVLAGENLIYIDRITLYYNSCWDCDRGYFCGEDMDYVDSIFDNATKSSKM